MTILQAIILGLVQGLAEFLPISSSGHLILARLAMGIADQANAPVYLVLDILLHAGTLIAVIVVFWKDWMRILRVFIESKAALLLLIALILAAAGVFVFRGFLEGAGLTMAAYAVCGVIAAAMFVLLFIKSKTLLLLFIASLPALAVSRVLGDFVESETVLKGGYLGIAFLVTGVFLLLAEWLSRRGGKHAVRANEPGIKHAIAAGCMQAVALLPGVSRSGSTILGGVASRLNRQAAAKFAFMMSAPAILGSLVIEGYDALEMGYFQHLETVPIAAGVAAAAISGYLAIRFMLRLITKVSLKWFALYAALAGIAVLVLQFAMPGLLPPLQLP